MINFIRPALSILVLFTILLGFFYPMLTTGLAQVLFPHQANGSMILMNGKVVGSELIGQQFIEPKYFWGRLSATSEVPYNGSASGGSNFSMLNPVLMDEVGTRIDAVHQADPGNTSLIPVDLVTSSGSGLDPQISVSAAEYQANRIAQARGISLGQVLSLIRENIHQRSLGFLGEETVNVLELNLALDTLQ